MTQRVLVIDDSEIVHAVIEQRLALDDVQVLHALDAKEGLRQALELAPDLVLLDLDLPDSNGFEICQALKASPVTSPIPVVFLTAATDVAAKVRGFDVGAVDYVSKDADPAEMRARVRAALRTKRYHDMLSARAQIDALTGLWNRRYFDQRLADELAAAQRYGRLVSLVMMDVDHFKQINDRLGHPFGDFVLQRLGERLGDSVRNVDAPCRYGGEELAIVLPETPVSSARATAERIRAAIADSPFETETLPLRVTASFGVASTELFDAPGAILLEQLVAAADAALYVAKRDGRNRVVVADSLPRVTRVPTPAPR